MWKKVESCRVPFFPKTKPQYWTHIEDGFLTGALSAYFSGEPKGVCTRWLFVIFHPGSSSSVFRVPYLYYGRANILYFSVVYPQRFSSRLTVCTLSVQILPSASAVVFSTFLLYFGAFIFPCAHHHNHHIHVENKAIRPALKRNAPDRS